MAANNQIGSGAVVITTSTDPLVAGLNKSEQDVKNWKNKTQATIDKPSGKGGPGAFQDLAKGAKYGEIAALGVTGAMVALGSAIAKAFTTAHIEEFNRQLELSGKLTDKVVASIEKRSTSILDKGSKLDPFAARKLYLHELDQKQKDLEGKQRTLATDRDALNKMRMDPWHIAEKQLPSTYSAPAILRESEAEAKVKDGEKYLESLHKQIEALKEADKTVGNSLLESIGAGAVKVSDDAKALAGDVKELTDSLKMQALTFGMTANQADVYKLKLRGANQAVIAEAEARAKHLKELENITKDKGPKLAGAIEAGSQEAFAASLTAKGFDVADSPVQAMRDVNKTLEIIAASNERFEKLMEELNAKWAAGF